MAIRVSQIEQDVWFALSNPAKGVSQKELDTILAKATPQMRAQIEGQLSAALQSRSQKSEGRGQKRKPSRIRVKTSWGRDTFIDRVGARVLRTRLRRALNPKSQKSDVRSQMSVRRNVKSNGCTRCGGSHDVAYCNAPVKQNLFGFGKKAKRRRKAKRQLKAVGLQARAMKLAARAEYLRKQNPLKPGKTRAAVTANIRQLVSEGKRPNQAIAIALRTAGLSRKRNGSFVESIIQGAGIAIGAGVVAATGAVALRSPAGKRLRKAVVKNGRQKNAGKGARAPRKNATASFEALQRQRSNVAQQIINLEALLRSPHADKKTVGAARDKLQKQFDALSKRAIAMYAKNPEVRSQKSEVRKNPDLLDLAAKGTAALLNAIQLKRHFSGNKKPRRRIQRAVRRRTAEQRMGGEIENHRGQRSEVGGRKNPASRSLQRIHKEFLGREPSGAVLNGYGAPGVPADQALMAVLRVVELENGKVQSWTSDVVWDKQNPGGLSRLGPKGAVLAGAQRGPLRRMYIILGAPMHGRNLPNGAHDYGEVHKVEYDAIKPHLYDDRMYRFFHGLGEEGGRKPRLIVHKNPQGIVLELRGGDYQIKREGIRD